jgi:hypothetical protein
MIQFFILHYKWIYNAPRNQPLILLAPLIASHNPFKAEHSFIVAASNKIFFLHLCPCCMNMLGKTLHILAVEGFKYPTHLGGRKF